MIMLVKNYHALATKVLPLTLMLMALLLTAAGCGYPQPDASINTNSKYSLTIMKTANRLASMPHKTSYRLLVNAHRNSYLRKMQMNDIKPSKELWKAEYKELGELNHIYTEEVATLAIQQALVQGWLETIIVAIKNKIDWLALRIEVRNINKSLKLAAEANKARKKGLASQELERKSMVDFAKVMGFVKESQNSTIAKITQLREFGQESIQQDIDEERYDLIFNKNRFYQIYLSKWSDEDLEALISSMNSSWQDKLIDTFQ